MRRLNYEKIMQLLAARDVANYKFANNRGFSIVMPLANMDGTVSINFPAGNPENYVLEYSQEEFIARHKADARSLIYICGVRRGHYTLSDSLLAMLVANQSTPR